MPSRSMASSPRISFAASSSRPKLRTLSSEKPKPSPLLQASEITKHYGATIALHNVSLSIEAGHIRALAGANGSGKSTLTKVLTGFVRPDKGTTAWKGDAIVLGSPAVARKHGIAAAYQELSLVPDLSVEANLWLGKEPIGRSGRIDKSLVRARSVELLALFDGVVSSRLSPETVISDLPPDERQIVEILKAYSNDPELLILDEATASLDGRQVRRLFELMRGWSAVGKALIIVTHRMSEMFAIAEHVTVLRNGQWIDDRPIRDLDAKDLVALMAGSRSAGTRTSPEAKVGPQAAPRELLAARIERAGKVKGVEFTLGSGELLGLGGLQGQGQSTVLSALFGNTAMQGEIRVAGKARKFHHPRHAIDMGLALIPGDRNREGLANLRPIFENLLSASWHSHARWQVLNMGRALESARSIAARLSLKATGLRNATSSLSGGNAQKVVIGKWLLRAPTVLLLDDPTKGVDVGTKAEFYQLLAELRSQGLGVILYSSDDDELITLSDRVLVMFDGAVVRELSRDALTHAELLHASLGM
jgi:ribose transport system ATP-binding protein